MDEFGNGNDRNLNSRGGSKSPVKVKVKLFEKQQDESPTKRRGVEQSVYRRSSSTRSKSPVWGNKSGDYDSDQGSASVSGSFSSPTRSKSPAAKYGGMSLPLNNPHSEATGRQELNSPTGSQPSGNWRKDKVYTPTRSTRTSSSENHESSPVRSKSPGFTIRDNTAVYSPNRSKSPGVVYHGNSGSYSPNRSKSPLVSYQGNSDVSSPIRSRSPGNNHQYSPITTNIGAHSPNRSKSPGVANRSNSGVYSPSRSKSPGVVNQGSNDTYTPNRSKSPLVNYQGNDDVDSPSRSKSPGNDHRSKSPGFNSQSKSEVYTPDRSKSPAFNRQENSVGNSRQKNISPGANSRSNDGTSSPSRSKSPGARSVHSSMRSTSPTSGSPVKTRKAKQGKDENVESSKPTLTNNDWRDEMNALFQSLPQDATERNAGDPGSPQTRSIAPSKVRRPNSFAVSDTRRGSTTKQSFSSDSSPNKWVFNGKAWEKDQASPEVTWKSGAGEETNDGGPVVGDTVNISWLLDNEDVDSVGETGDDYVEQPEEQEREPMVAKATEGIFRNSLHYNLTEWERGASYDKNKPKRADEFIQNMCNQVRNQVEYFCGQNFYSYEALSYKVKITGPTGIFYYIKVCVSPSNCLHLRIFSDKRELTAIPSLQAILERSQIDNGNISYF